MKKTLKVLLLITVVFFAVSSMAADKVVVIPLYSGSGTKVQTVTTATGRVWMDRNLGALRVAGSATDSLAYGWLYQWGRPADGHESPASPTTPDLSLGDVPGHGKFILVTAPPEDWRSTQNDQLWVGLNGTNNPCPSGFRIPTEAELDAERLTWSSNDAAGAFASPLKLVLPGFRESKSGNMVSPDLWGFYMSSTVDVSLVRSLRINNTDPAGFSSVKRSLGSSVRCIKN